MSVRLQNTRLPALERLEQHELRSARELDPFYEDWRALWVRSGRTPFQSPMWLLPWIEQFTRDNLRVVVWKRSEQVLAVAPFYTWSEGFQTKLLLAGNGISDYLDLCVHPTFQSELRNCLREWLGSRCELLDFDQLCPDSILTRLGLSIAAGDSCPILDLRGKSLSDCAPPRQLEKLRYYRRRAGKFGKWQIRQADLEHVPESMRELFRLHALRWSARAQSGVLHDESVQAFHVRAAQNLARTGNLRLYALELNSQVVAVLYAFADARTTYYYLSGFDPEFNAISPGTLLIGHAIDNAIAESHCQFNFLRGAEPYKYAWGAADEKTYRLVGFPPATWP